MARPIVRKKTPLVARHPIFWLVDIAVVLTTLYFWGWADAIFTVGIFALGMFEGSVFEEESEENERDRNAS